MNDSERNRLIERVRKIMALASSPNENEAAAAAEKAQAMLAEYNLSMSDISVEEKREDFVTDAEIVTDSFPWRRYIANGVADLYFCSYFFAYRKEPSSTRSCGYVRYDVHNFVGAAHNIAVAKMMFTYLSETVERLAEEGSSKVSPGERTPYRTSFKMAAARRLYTRIQVRIAEARAGRVKTEAGTNLPALADLYDQAKAQLQDFMAQNHKAVKPSSDRSKQTHLGGLIDGRAAGDKIGLDAQVTGKAGHLLGR